MRNALRDAELPPPAGGWERLQRELGGAAPGPEVSGTKPRGSVWRIYRPRIAAAAAAVLILAVAGEFLLRPDKALENDGTVIASVAEDGATAVAIPQPAEPETVRDALAKAVGLSREQVAGEASSAGRRSLLAAAAGQPAQTAALKNLRTDGEPAVRPERLWRRKFPERRRRRRPVKSQRRHPVKSRRRRPEILRRRRLPAKGLRSRLPGGPQRGRRPARPVVRGSPTSRS